MNFIIKKIISFIFTKKISPMVKNYLDRNINKDIWIEEFGEKFYIADNIMNIFAESFLFEKSDRFKFHPDDHIYDIYRAIYPYEWIPDCLECEIFVEELEKNMKINIESLWKYENITFRDIVNEAINSN